MKTITTLKYDRQYTTVECTTCKAIIQRRKDKLKYYNPFCSEVCVQKYKDPKQFEIMSHKDTPNFNYLVGLICTDGHIGYPGCTKTTTTYYCNIKMRDGDLLEGIQKIFGGHLRKEGKNGIQKTWRVGNIDFVKYLQSIGLTNNKTYNLNVDNYFKHLSDKNKTAFLRGVIDGDGCISITSRKTNGMRVGSYICSASKSFITMIETHFNNGVLTEVTKNQQNSYKKDIVATGSMFYYYMNGNRVVENLRSIYDMQNDELYLKRKYAKYKAIEAYQNSK